MAKLATATDGHAPNGQSFNSGHGISRLFLADVPVDLLTAENAVRMIVERARSKAGEPLAVASVNLDHLHYFGAGGRWHGALDAAGRSGTVEWLNLVDGAPVAARASNLTQRQWSRLAGSDLIGPLLDECEEHGLSVGFLGGAPQTQERLLQVLPRLRPNLRIAGCWAPERSMLGNAAANLNLCSEIAGTGVDVLVVCLGKPRQELWITENGAATGASALDRKSVV